MCTGTFSSRRAADGFGPRATTVTFRNASMMATGSCLVDSTLIKVPRADTCEKNHHIEVAALTALREAKSVLILLERNFPHRWRDDRFAAITPDKFGGFRCAPAFKAIKRVCLRTTCPPQYTGRICSRSAAHSPRMT